MSRWNGRPLPPLSNQGIILLHCLLCLEDLCINQCLVSQGIPELMEAPSRPHSSLGQSQGSAHASWQLPPICRLHSRRMLSSCFSPIPSATSPWPHFAVLVDFSRVLYFHLPPWKGSNFRGRHNKLSWNPKPSPQSCDPKWLCALPLTLVSLGLLLWVLDKCNFLCGENVYFLKKFWVSVLPVELSYPSHYVHILLVV